MYRAGTTDSALTNHGVLQIDHLGQHFVSQSIQFDSVFASDLSRARITAEGICRHQAASNNGSHLTPILTTDLRERDFGSLEGQRWTARTVLARVESESKVSMKQRATSFLNEYLVPLFFEYPDQELNVAIVSHGIILRILWRCLVEVFDPMHLSVAPGIPLWKGEPATLISPVWSNTGYMTLSIQETSAQSQPTSEQCPEHRDITTTRDMSIENTEEDISIQSDSVTGAPVLLQGWSMRVMTIDEKGHLSSLRRTRGGIGSATHDTSQKRIDHFFK